MSTITRWGTVLFLLALSAAGLFGQTATPPAQGSFVQLGGGAVCQMTHDGFGNIYCSGAPISAPVSAGGSGTICPPNFHIFADPLGYGYCMATDADLSAQVAANGATSNGTFTAAAKATIVAASTIQPAPPAPPVVTQPIPAPVTPAAPGVGTGYAGAVPVVAPPAAAVPTTAPAGFANVPFGNGMQLVPTLGTVLQSMATSMESESILSLVGEGMVNPAGVVANLNAWVTSYCAEQPLAPGCGSSAAAIAAPYIAQLQAAFALVPASQWNPLTFTATGMYVNAIGYVNAAAATPAPSAPVVPQLIVGTCYPVSGINSPSGTMCYGAPGVTVAMVQALGPQVSQNGVLYDVHIVRGLMGISYFFEPVTQ